MIELYHCRGARSFRPLWMLEELEIPYTLHLLPFPPRHRAKGYLQINPLGTVPCLLTNNAMMTESVAMVEYLAAVFGNGRLSLPPSDPHYSAYLNFLHMGEATLTFPQTLFLRYAHLEPVGKRNPQVADDYRRWFLARLDSALGLFVGEYACGNSFTAADISVGYAIKLARRIGLGADLKPEATAYLNRLSARAGYKRAQAAERPA